MQPRRVVGVGWLGLVLGCSGGGGPQTTAINTLGDGDSTGGGDATSTVTGPDDSPSSDDATSVVDTTMGNTTGPDPEPTTDDGGSGSSDSGAVSCADDPAACTAWILPSGANAWQPVALDADSSLAPSGPVLAAFDVEGELEGIVLTDSNIHVVDLAARTWVRSESRATALPDLAGDEILTGYSIPAYWGEMFGGEPGVEGVTFLSATTAYIYNYDIASESFAFDFATTDFGTSWDAPAAPTPAQMRGSWLDLTNDDGWNTQDLMGLCGVPGRVGPYTAYVAVSDMHVADGGNCFEFFDPVVLPDYAPFGLAQAPAASDVGAMLYNETMGLWVFR